MDGNIDYTVPLVSLWGSRSCRTNQQDCQQTGPESSSFQCSEKNPFKLVSGDNELEWKYNKVKGLNCHQMDATLKYMQHMGQRHLENGALE